MAVNAQVLRLLGTINLSLDSHVDQATRALVAGWARAWDEIVGEWQEAITAAFASIEQPGGGYGAWPTQTELDRLDRVKRAADLTRAHLVALGELTGVTVSASVPKVTLEATDWERSLIQAQLPPVDLTGTIAATFNRVDQHAVDAIVRRSTQQITALSRPLAADAEEAMRRTLIRGVLIGDHPEVAAREMLRRVEGGFNGGLQRAMVIARTELLDAHRAGSLAVDRKNAGTVTGWLWGATLDQRTCPSCWSQHGSVHAPDEPGPSDHPQGRCSRIPQTVTWAELGLDIPEPPSLLADGEQTFNNLPREQQLAIMGPERLGLLDSGQVAWSDLSMTKHAAGWRDSQVVTPVKVLAARAAA